MKRVFTLLQEFEATITSGYVLIPLVVTLAISATVYCFSRHLILSYGDAESHINIAKRIVDSITPGFSQLGGVWLPLPHLLMVPFVYFTPLWRTGLAGSIIGGLAYVVACFTIYKLLSRLTHDNFASILGFLVFALNPNILFMQSTPLTEMPLLCFFILSIYFFVLFFEDVNRFLYLVFAAFFGFCATLCRYDGWFLVLFEFGILVFLFLVRTQHMKWFGRIILFSTLAFFGIALWFVWDWAILGDPMYFSNSQFSASSQQLAWLARGQLPARGNIELSFLYYVITSANNIGYFLFAVSILGLILYILFVRKTWVNIIAFLLLFSPFIFYIFTLYVGQSIIFTPELTPKWYMWHLFNVRYGIVMLPLASFLVASAAAMRIFFLKPFTQTVLLGIILYQTFLFSNGNAPVVTVQDGLTGLSRYVGNDAQKWLNTHYDKGLILFDDYSRTVSVIHTTIPMKDVIYIGNKPYWNQSLVTPEKYARWIVMQKDDAVWNSIYNTTSIRKRLYKYFQKVYTSPNVLIFRKITTV